MPISRRSLLRNSTLLAGGAAVGAALEHFVAKPHQHSQAEHPQTKMDKPWLSSARPPAKSFDKGIRVVFAGSWLFCADPASKDANNKYTGMLAIGRDIATPAHIFPFGPWQDNDLDVMKTPLDPNGTTSAKAYSPYPVTIMSSAAAGYVSGKTLDDVFQGAVNSGPCTYLTSPSVSINTQTPGLRIISLPIPARIIPAVYRPFAFVHNNPATVSVAYPKHPDQTPASFPAFGAPTVLICEYPSAYSLSFTNPKTQTPTVLMGDAAGLGDFHFHVLPQQVSGMDHGPDMFAGLREALTIGGAPIAKDDFKLITPPNVTEDTLYLMRGADVPGDQSNYVKDLELGLEFETYHIDKASCTGGGILTGGCPDIGC